MASRRTPNRAQRSSADPLPCRTRAHLTELVAGLAVEPPGLVDVVHWTEFDPIATPTGIDTAVARLDEHGLRRGLEWSSRSES